MDVRLQFFFFFKQKTAYEMRISDWSSDVCSSDLALNRPLLRPLEGGQGGRRLAVPDLDDAQGLQTDNEAGRVRQVLGDLQRLVAGGVGRRKLLLLGMAERLEGGLLGLARARPPIGRAPA